MHRFALVLTLGLFMTCFTLQAQSASTEVSTLFPEILNANPIDVEEDWTYYQDKDNHLFLIDLESLSYNIVEIVLRNSNTAQIVFRDDVFGLPVNSIYELDYTYYSKGNYTLELRSFVRTIVQEVSFH